MDNFEIENGVLERATAWGFEITIPAEVEKIAPLFLDDDTIKAIYVDEGNENFVSIDGVLFSKDLKELVKFPPGKEDSECIIPDGVEKIARYAFSGCENLERVEIGSTVTEIGESAFENCSNLKEIILPEELKEISERMLYDCYSLREIKIPESVRWIGRYAMRDCKSLVKVDLPQYVTVDEYALANCNCLKELYAKDASFQRNALRGNKDLTLYVYEDSLAHNYAEENKINYEIVEYDLDDEDFE